MLQPVRLRFATKRVEKKSTQVEVMLYALLQSYRSHTPVPKLLKKTVKDAQQRNNILTELVANANLQHEDPLFLSECCKVRLRRL